MERELTMISLQIPKRLAVALRVTASQFDKSRSQLIREFAEKGLKEIQKNKESADGSANPIPKNHN